MITIGLVDNNDLFRNSLKSLLLTTTLFSITIEATDELDFLSKQKLVGDMPVIIITNYEMDSLDRKRLIQTLRKQNPELKILVLSFLNHRDVISSLIVAGANGVLNKEIKAHLFIRAICEVVNGKFVLSDNDSYKLVDKTEIEMIKVSKISLTNKQIHFIRLCAMPNLTYKEIAYQLQISPKTVDRHRDELFKKLNLTSRAGILLYAIQNGLFKQTN